VLRQNGDMDLDALTTPPTPAGALALEVATRYLTPALLHHSVRSYAFARDHAERTGIVYDEELLYVAALLHDIGLAPEFDSHTVAFEDAGGHVAWVFGAGAGWSAERRDRLSLAIVDHMRDEVDADADPEGNLLEISTSVDISGRDAALWSDDVKRAVLGRYPRLDLGVEFVRCFQAQAHRKPDSAAAGAIRSGIADRIVVNPLEDY